VFGIQANRVLVAAERVIETAEVLQRDAAGRPRVRGPSDHLDRALVMPEGLLIPSLLHDPVALSDLAVRYVEEDEGRRHAARRDPPEEGRRERVAERTFIHPEPSEDGDEGGAASEGHEVEHAAGDPQELAALRVAGAR